MEDYVNFEQAKKLKELGFDWECNHFYDGKFPNELLDLSYYHNFNDNGASQDCSAPTMSQAQKWLREVKGMYVEISRYHLNNFAYELKFDYDSNHKYCCQAYMTPEEALLRGIDEALELLK